MKKIIALIALLSIILVSNFTCGYAESAVTEVSDLRVMVNGKIISLDVPPIIINESSLLPLRSLLNNLGVPNDEKSIVWNQNDKSVTINHNAKKIYLKIGSNKAYVNDKEVAIDVLPVLYNDKTYMPVRFIAENLDNQVGWNETLRLISITDNKDFNEINSLINKSDTAMKSLKQFKNSLQSDYTMSTLDKSRSINGNYSISENVDFGKKLASSTTTSYMSYNNKTTSEVKYIINGDEYSKENNASNWTSVKYDLNKFNDDFLPQLNEGKSLCYGLHKVNTNNSNVIKLEGGSVYDELVNSFVQGIKESDTTVKIIPRDIQTTVLIDKNTNIITNLSSKLQFDYKTDAYAINLELNISMKFFDFDKDINFVFPGVVTASQQNAGRWKSLSTAPSARQEVTVANVDGKIYVVGGSSSQVEEFNPKTNSWENKSSLPSNLIPTKRRVAAIGLNGKLYVVGGKSSKQLWEYDVKTDKWQKKADMNKDRGYCAVAVYNGKIYAAGGNGAGTKSLEEYDPATDT